jgi:hypothetical protein
MPTGFVGFQQFPFWSNCLEQKQAGVQVQRRFTAGDQVGAVRRVKGTFFCPYLKRIFFCQLD